MKTYTSIYPIVLTLTLIAVGSTTPARGESLSEYIRPDDLKRFHFPIDRDFYDVWFQFYVTSSERDTIRTLVKAGPEIVPSIISAIQDKDLYKRRYAIGALGYLHVRSCIEALMAIVRNKEEADYFRGDALESLFRIDKELGRVESKALLLREEHEGQDKFYIRIARKIVAEPEAFSAELPSGP